MNGGAHEAPACPREPSGSRKVRGLLAEYGIKVPQGRSNIQPAVAGILGNGGTAETTLSPRLLDVLADMYGELVHMKERVEEDDRRDRLSESRSGC